MLAEPRSGRLVAWANAWLAGATSLDESTSRACRGETHRVLPLEPVARPEALILALGRLRRAGARGFRLALPAPGDPLGLAGPPALTEAAIEAGEAVVVLGVAAALVPSVAGPPEGSVSSAPRQVTWQLHPAEEWPVALPRLREAERELVAAMAEASDSLGELDVAGAGQRTLELLTEIRRGDGRPDDLAPGYPPAARRVLAQARRLAAIVALARAERGVAVSAAGQRARDQALDPLERAARRARMAAYNVVLEPGEGALGGRFADEYQSSTDR